jgi:hypothetical protein
MNKIGRFLIFGVSLNLVLLIVSCNQAPKNFCDCLEASDQVNVSSNKVLSGSTDEESKRKLIESRKVKKIKCADYVEAGGNKMREWKKDCWKKREAIRQKKVRKD